jgi:PEP-CTERM motif
MRVNMVGRLLGCIAVLTVVVAAANAGIIADDNFNRPDGSLVGTVPTPGPGGVWTSHSGTLGDLLISSGQAIVQHGVPSEDAHTQFVDVTSGVITADLDVTVNDDTQITAGDSEYFAHFMTDGSFNFTSRLYVVPANTPGNDYTLGLSTSSGGFTETFPTDFTYGDQIHVSLTYDFGAGLSSLTVGATTITSSVVGSETLLNSFALRQSDSINNETISVDNLVVSSVPEPTTLALMFLGVACLAVRRRSC